MTSNADVEIEILRRSTREGIRRFTRRVDLAGLVAWLRRIEADIEEARAERRRLYRNSAARASRGAPNERRSFRSRNTHYGKWSYRTPSSERRPILKSELEGLLDWRAYAAGRRPLLGSVTYRPCRRCEPEALDPCSGLRGLAWTSPGRRRFARHLPIDPVDHGCAVASSMPACGTVSLGARPKDPRRSYALCIGTDGRRSWRTTKGTSGVRKSSVMQTGPASPEALSNFCNFFLPRIFETRVSPFPISSNRRHHVSLVQF